MPKLATSAIAIRHFRRRFSEPSFSLDDMVRSEQQRRRDREAERLCRSEIDDQLELRGLLDRKIPGFRTPQDLVDVHRGLPHQIRPARAIGYKPSGFHVLPQLENRGQSM